MKVLYIVYTTDGHHSRASAEPIGVCTTLKATKKVINQHIIKYALPKLSNDDTFCLANYKQTQGYKGDGEFVIDGVEANKLI